MYEVFLFIEFRYLLLIERYESAAIRARNTKIIKYGRKERLLSNVETSDWSNRRIPRQIWPNPAMIKINPIKPNAVHFNKEISGSRISCLLYWSKVFFSSVIFLPMESLRLKSNIYLLDHYTTARIPYVLQV